MNKSKNILDFFKIQSTDILCPACGTSLPKSRLNIHLDTDCSSGAGTVKYVSNNFNHGSTNEIAASRLCGNSNKQQFSKSVVKKNSKRSRLSLKEQKKNCYRSIGSSTNRNYPVESEVITLDDDSTSSTHGDDTKVLKFANTKTSNLSNVAIQQTGEMLSSNLADCEEIMQKSTSNIYISSIIEGSIPHNRVSNLAICGESVQRSTSDVHIISVINKESSLLKEVCNDTLNLQDSSMAPSFQTTKSSNFIDNSDVEALLNDVEASLEIDNNVFVEKSEENQTTENYSPYYIANFKHILNTVLNEDFNKILFNDEDMSFIKSFESCSDSAQKLYVRLFQRKYKWLRLNKINYPNITKDPSGILDQLVKGKLIDSGLDQIDLETALDLLSFPEAKNVVKQFNFNSTGKNKKDIKNMLLKHCKEHKTVFFSNGSNGVSGMMLKKVKQMLGPCYRVSLLPKRLFTRILMLFSLSTISEDDDDAAGGQQQQLFTLLQVNKGELTFPNYNVNHQTRIFIDRDELIRYEEAKQLENDIMNAVESKNLDLAKELYIEAKEEFEDQLLYSFVERAASLPSYLKKFTSFHVYIRCMTQGVDILQRLKQYKEAVELLKRLLDQKVFCQDYHGHWWDRMALNLEQHLKQRHDALEAIKAAMHDRNVRVGYRYSLLTRALRILKTVDDTDELKNEILEATDIIEAPKVIIKGRLLPRSIHGRKNVFISSSSALTDEDDITVLGVEQLAIEHYKDEGFPEGIHGEGSTFHAIYGLLFWDIIYDGNIPDAFISPYQTHPLDLNHESFFIRREKQIMSQLENLRKSNIEELKEIVKSTWEAHIGQLSLVMWDHFTGVEHILGLVSCMGNNLICGICERLARDFRFTRSGVPDLVVWNPDSLQVKIVEVKGPGDKLSSKQILWLDYLLKLGAQAEVCHIEAVGSKKLRKE